MAPDTSPVATPKEAFVKRRFVALGTPVPFFLPVIDGVQFIHSYRGCDGDGNVSKCGCDSSVGANGMPPRAKEGDGKRFLREGHMAPVSDKESLPQQRWGRHVASARRKDKRAPLE